MQPYNGLLPEFPNGCRFYLYNEAEFAFDSGIKQADVIFGYEIVHGGWKRNGEQKCAKHYLAMAISKDGSDRKHAQVFGLFDLEQARIAASDLVKSSDDRIAYVRRDT